MKTSVLLLFVFITSLTFSQNDYGDYESTFFKEKYSIQISSKEDDNSLYIQTATLDKLYNKHNGLVVKNNLLENFRTNLSEAREKYITWVQTAKENNVNELNKTMKLPTRTKEIEGYFQAGSNIHFDFSVMLTYEFKILNRESGNVYLLIIRSGKLQSTKNQFTTNDGSILVFENLEELDAFIQLISSQAIEDYNSKPSKESLFE